jgi:hypothetical protein
VIVPVRAHQEGMGWNPGSYLSILDLALADGLNPAPLADAGWAVAALEVPVRVGGETVVCDVVLFNPQAGHLLVVEAKSGANLEPEQGRKPIALTPELLVIAGGITVPKWSRP